MSTSSRRSVEAAVGRDHLTLVLGRPESGKSRWAAEEIRRTAGNVVAWDPTAAFEGAGRWDFQGPARDFLRKQASSTHRIARTRVYGGDAEFKALCEYVRRAGRCLFVVDEAHLFVPHSIAKDHPFRSVLVTMRHLQVQLVLVAWRPYNLAAYTRSGWSRIVAFSLTDQRSLDWLRAEAGASAEDLAAIPKLPTGRSRRSPRYLTLRP